MVSLYRGGGRRKVHGGVSAGLSEPENDGFEGKEKPEARREKREREACLKQSSVPKGCQ